MFAHHLFAGDVLRDDSHPPPPPRCFRVGFPAVTGFIQVTTTSPYSVSPQFRATASASAFLNRSPPQHGVPHTSCRIAHCYRHCQFVLPFRLAHLLFAYAAPLTGARYSHFLDVYGHPSSLQIPQPPHPTWWLPATASTSARTPFPQLQYPLPYTSSAITGFFPSYYRLLILLHHMFAHHGIGMLRQTGHHYGTCYITLPPLSGAFSLFLAAPPTTPTQGCAAGHRHNGFLLRNPLPHTSASVQGVAHRYFGDTRRPLRLMFAHHGLRIGLVPLSPATAPTISHSIGPANLSSSLLPQLPPPSPHRHCPPWYRHRFAYPHPRYGTR